MQRYAELDGLRGLMLVLMTVTHLPTWFSAALGQPFGFVSAAEGFVFVSAFLVGSVYGRIARERGTAAMRRALWSRTGKIYLAHVGVLLFLLWVLVPIAVARGAHPVTDLASFYVTHPHEALLAGVLLVYNPPLLDILPMYVLFMAASPLLLQIGARRGWTGIATISAMLWVLAQLGAGPALHGALVRAFDLAVPYRQTGAFSFLAWQLMWIAGLWAGAHAPGSPVMSWLRTPRVVITSALVAVAFLVWRHATGQVPSGPAWLVDAVDKWHLGALRLADFGALVALVVWARAAVAEWAQRSLLTTLGKASLTVFCAHLVICLGALVVVADSAPAQLHWRDSALLAGTLVALYAVAWVYQAGRRRVGPAAAAVIAKPAARTAR
jgi:hypothetical protein